MMRPRGYRKRPWATEKDWAMMPQNLGPKPKGIIYILAYSHARTKDTQ